MSKNLQCDGSNTTGTHPQFIACGTYKVPPGFTATIEDGNVCIRPIPLTEFEKAVEAIYESCGVKELQFRKKATELLAIAQKELENSDWIKDIREWCYNKGHLEGYAKGQEDAEKRHREITSFRMTFPSWPPPCYTGGPCTNPLRDCINCPQQGTSGIAKTDTNIK